MEAGCSPTCTHRGKDEKLELHALNMEDPQSWLPGAIRGLGSGNVFHTHCIAAEPSRDRAPGSQVMPADITFPAGPGMPGFPSTRACSNQLEPKGERTEMAPPVLLVISFQSGVPRLPLVTSPNGEHTAFWGGLPHPPLPCPTRRQSQ